MPKYSGFAVSLWMGNRRLSEYQIEVGTNPEADGTHSPLVTCWVASEAGKVRNATHYTAVTDFKCNCRRSRYIAMWTASRGKAVWPCSHG